MISGHASNPATAHQPAALANRPRPHNGTIAAQAVAATIARRSQAGRQMNGMSVSSCDDFSDRAPPYGDTSLSDARGFVA
jgi:hypothetical protein